MGGTNIFMEKLTDIKHSVFVVCKRTEKERIFCYFFFLFYQHPLVISQVINFPFFFLPLMNHFLSFGNNTNQQNAKKMIHEIFKIHS